MGAGMPNIVTIESQLACVTRGLKPLIGYEIRIRYEDSGLVDAAREFLTRTGTHIETGARIRPKETMSHGCWAVQFKDAGDTLDVWEFDAEWNAFAPGGTLALTYWQDQTRACRDAQSVFDPPLAPIAQLRFRKAC
jgi:hypothetical protein